MAMGDRRRKRRKARTDRAADRKSARRDNKQTRRDSRRQARLDKKAGRRDSRTDRIAERQATRTAAYEAGMDPDAWISGLGSAAGGVLTSRFNNQTQQRRDSMSMDAAALGLKDPFASTAMGSREGQAPAGNNTMLLIAGAGLLAFMMMKK